MSWLDEPEPKREQIKQWHDWTKEEQERYEKLKYQYEHAPRGSMTAEDFRWFTLRRRNLAFYQAVKVRARRQFLAPIFTKDNVVGGYNGGRFSQAKGQLRRRR